MLSDLQVRRFFWVCLAETVRKNSNSRTSTYKLHVRPEDKQNATEEDVAATFVSTAQHNLQIVADFVAALREEKLLNRAGVYRKPIALSYGDSAVRLPTIERSRNGYSDVVVTSPPYGDNKTTVPYGQAAWLPMQWIDLGDIDHLIPRSAIANSYTTDNKSLGGIRARRTFTERLLDVENAGPITKNYISRLKNIKGDGLSRFVHFAFDLKAALGNVVTATTPDAHIVLTLGHRNISGTVCPLTDFCSEVLAQQSVHEIMRIDRQIQSKRMPDKNGHSATITHEYISILQKR